MRDAAAFVCWALARAYSGREVAGAVAALAPALLAAAAYDREVNCRRAAAAAFQVSPLGFRYMSGVMYWRVLC